MQSFSQFTSYLLTFFSVSGTVLDTVDSLVNKIDKNSCTSQPAFLVEEDKISEIYRQIEVYKENYSRQGGPRAKLPSHAPHTALWLLLLVRSRAIGGTWEGGVRIWLRFSGQDHDCCVINHLRGYPSNPNEREWWHGPGGRYWWKWSDSESPLKVEQVGFACNLDRKSERKRIQGRPHRHRPWTLSGCACPQFTGSSQQTCYYNQVTDEKTGTEKMQRSNSAQTEHLSNI